MTKIILPATINPPTFRRDGSAKISFETRELTAEETHIILSMRHLEGWLCYQPNPDDFEIPEEPAQVEDEKSASERLRNVMFVWYKQETDAGKFVGLFETFRKEKMEKIIEGVKTKLNN